DVLGVELLVPGLVIGEVVAQQFGGPCVAQVDSLQVGHTHQRGLVGHDGYGDGAEAEDHGEDDEDDTANAPAAGALFGLGGFGLRGDHSIVGKRSESFATGLRFGLPATSQLSIPGPYLTVTNVCF